MVHAVTNKTRTPSGTNPNREPLPRANDGWPQLQSGYGNQAILRTLHRSHPTIQRKLPVNQPGDAYEQEADRVADQVMRMPAPVAVQRQCPACAKEEKLQRKCDQCAEEEKKVQRKETGSGPESAPPIVHDVLNSPGQPLDADTRAFFEPRFGRDFTHVRVHADARAAESAQSVGARAYATGRHVVFNHGQYAPGSGAGMRLLAHELTHVTQQNPVLGSAHDSGAAASSLPPVQARTTANSVQCDKPKPSTSPSAKLDIRFTGQKSTADQLSFAHSVACSEDLNLFDCSKAWVWNVEVVGDVSDDAAQWNISQSYTGHKKGVKKTGSGSSVDFDSPLKEPDDAPTSNNVQQNSGEKKLFWIDAPGHLKATDTATFDSVVQVQNFVSKICSKTSSKTCAEVKWFLKLVVKPGGKLDTKNSKAGKGTESTKL